MQVGDRIRIQDNYGDNYDYTVEEFRHCLGIFLSDQYREAGKFSPLCMLYYDGPHSETAYISNFGEYRTGQVPKWMNIPN